MSDKPIGVDFSQADMSSLSIASSSTEVVTLKPDGRMFVLLADGTMGEVDGRAAMWLYAACMTVAAAKIGPWGRRLG